MTQVDENLTRKVADLARLDLTPDELKRYTVQLAGILKYVEKLSEVNVDGVEPMTRSLLTNLKLREDLVEPSPVDEHGKPKVLKHAPDVLDDGYKVPPIL